MEWVDPVCFSYGSFIQTHCTSKYIIWRNDKCQGNSLYMHTCMRFEVLTAVKMSVLVSWAVTLFGPVGTGDIYFLQPSWKWGQYVPPQPWYLPTSPHGVTAQKTKIGMNTTKFQTVKFGTIWGLTSVSGLALSANTDILVLASERTLLQHQSHLPTP
jgi:hypothetical protein